MAKNKKQEEEQLSLDTLFSDFAYDVEDLIDSEEGPTLDIIEFVERELDLGPDFELTRQQKIILKTIYNLPLDQEDKEILEHWQGEDRTTWEPGQRYQTLVCEAGRRGGKTQLVSIIATYEFYKLCKMESPQAYYRISSSTPITILAIATNYVQSKEATFRHITGAIKCCRYLSRLQQNGYITVGLEEVKHEQKMIYIKPGNSKSSSQVGGTLKALILDEVARFANKEGKSNAFEIWTNLGAALTTFKEDALKVAISSAWEQDDAIYQLYERTRNSPSAIGFRLRSKDLNPDHGGDDNPLVRDAFEADPQQAYLEYYGIRPTVQDAFLDERLVDRSFTGKQRVHLEPYTRQTKAGDYLTCLDPVSIEEPNHSSGSIVHLDPAIKGDFYGGAIGHAEFNEEDRLVVYIDAVFCWEGTKDINVSMSDAFDVLKQVHQVRPIDYISADRFNSTETLQKFMDLGIKTDAFKFSSSQQMDFYSSLKQVLNEDRLVLPTNTRWRALLERELKQVQLQKGNKIDHPPSGSKDLADCVAVVTHHLNERAFADRATQGTFEKTKIRKFHNTKRRPPALQKVTTRKQHFMREWDRTRPGS